MVGGELKGWRGRFRLVFVRFFVAVFLLLLCVILRVYYYFTARCVIFSHHSCARSWTNKSQRLFVLCSCVSKVHCFYMPSFLVELLLGSHDSSIRFQALQGLKITLCLCACVRAGVGFHRHGGRRTGEHGRVCGELADLELPRTGQQVRYPFFFLPRLMLQREKRC